MTRTLISRTKKCIAYGLIGSLVFGATLSPYIALAQANEPELPQGNGGATADLLPQQNVNFEIEDPQARAYLQGQQGYNQNTTRQAVTDVVGSGLSCSAAQILGQLLTTAISSAITSVITSAVGTVAENANLIVPTVPTNLKYDEAGQHIVGDVRARSGSFTLFGIMINVSWDSIAWCIVNAMIEYIADATIAWANSGFNGNPAFLQNPERFFRDLADYEAGTIIRDIAYGASGGAVNICEPFRVRIAVGLAESYPGYGRNALNARYRGMSCSLSQIQQNNFFQGVYVTTGPTGSATGARRGISWSDWLAVTQNDANNPYGAYILANEALYSAVSARQNELTFEIGLNNGWLNFKKCKDGETDPSKCDTVTPGRLIESQLNQTLGLSKQRLVMADKFDQMITAIVNNLIKIALNKLLENNQ